MIQINPHINFNGNAEQAFLFYQSVFGGEFSKIVRFKEFASPEFPMDEKELEKLMHIELPIGNCKLIGNDVPEFMGKVNENENRSKISINTNSREEAMKIYIGLSSGGNIEVPLDVNDIESKFGMFRDKYGIEWIIEVG